MPSCKQQYVDIRLKILITNNIYSLISNLSSLITIISINNNITVHLINKI